MLAYYQCGPVIHNLKKVRWLLSRLQDDTHDEPVGQVPVLLPKREIHGRAVGSAVIAVIGADVEVAQNCPSVQ